MRPDAVEWNELLRDLRTGTVARMTTREFEELPEYSCSLPTGTRIGKQWRRREPYMLPGPFFAFSPSREYAACVIDPPRIEVRWFLGEYVDSDRPDRVGIVWRRIELVGAEQADGAAPAA